MGSLAQYIQSMQKQGYTDKQIRAELTKSSYPKSAIDTAFSAAKGDTPIKQTTKKTTNLQSYINTLLSQGYEIEQLRPYLLDQGYSKQQIDSALPNNTAQPKTKLPIFISALFLLIAIAIGATLYMVVQTADPTTTIPTAPPPNSLSLQLQTQQTTLLPGESLRVEANIQNTGTTRTGTILFTLQGPQGTIYSNQKDRPLTNDLTTAELIQIPQNAPPGDYLLTVEILGENKQQTTTIKITGVQVPIQESVALEEPKKVIATTNVAQNQIDQAALKAQGGNTRQAQDTCEEITNQARRDECYEKLVLASKTPSLCESISSQEAKDTCYMPFILEGQYQYCESLQSSERKELCEQLQLLDSL